MSDAAPQAEPVLAEDVACLPAPALRCAAFELDLDPDQLGALLRQPELLVPGTRRRVHAARPLPLSLIWHDTPLGALAEDGIALAQRDRRPASAAPRLAADPQAWVRTALVARPGAICPPGDATILRESLTGEVLAAEAVAALPVPLLPVAAFEGSTRVLRAQAPRIEIVQGDLRALTASRPVCRVLIEGEGAASLVVAWSALLVATPALHSLAAEALMLSGRAVPSRPLGAPQLNAEMDVSEAYAATIAHLAGVMAHHAGLATGQHGPEPVHQMRVALRRLRSAITLFRRAAMCPEIDAALVLLKQLGGVLGPARDWDVFTTGLGRRVGAAFADEKAVTELLAAAERKRQASYAALAQHLDSFAWRALLASLAGLALTRPWETQGEAPGETHAPEDAARAARQRELQATRLRPFAAHALSRRLRALLAPGEDLSGLPVAALHDIRLCCKRLRYAAEFFAPAFPGRATRRFLSRLSDLQEDLGQLNDGAVAAELMAQLDRSGARGAAERQLAIGMVRGFVAAGSVSARRRIERDWRRLLRQEGFWL